MSPRSGARGGADFSEAIGGHFCKLFWGPHRGDCLATGPAVLGAKELAVQAPPRLAWAAPLLMGAGAAPL
eukprot:7267511-Pyramimonas_sp.AAC.1